MKKILALGFFDCIHIGHRFLLLKGQEEGVITEHEFVVTTFNDDFLSFMGRPVEEILLLSERKEILHGLGMDIVSVFPSDRSFFDMSKVEFCRYIEKMDLAAIICGKDYRFGAGAEGDVTFLQSYFLPRGIEVMICDLVLDGGEKVSTKSIKEMLIRGEIERANSLLTHPFFYEGKIIEGRKDGGKMGIPTINIDIPRGKIKIKSGVYATETVLNGKQYLSVTNVGAHPTFADESFNVETHIIDFDTGNVYGNSARIVFRKYIREIISFNNKEDLAEQIKKDIAKVKMEDKW